MDCALTLMAFDDGLLAVTQATENGQPPRQTHTAAKQYKSRTIQINSAIVRN